MHYLDSKYGNNRNSSNKSSTSCSINGFNTYFRKKTVSNKNRYRIDSNNKQSENNVNNNTNIIIAGINFIGAKYGFINAVHHQGIYDIQTGRPVFSRRVSNVCIIYKLHYANYATSQQFLQTKIYNHLEFTLIFTANVHIFTTGFALKIQ